MPHAATETTAATKTTTVTETVPSRRRERTLAWTVMVLVMGLWVFVVFFLDGILANIAREKLEALVSTSTHGEYQLSFTRFTYHRGTVFAGGMDLRRVGYRRHESGTTLRDLGIDSVTVSGISWWDILFGKPIGLQTIHTYEPNVYFCTFAQGEDQWKLLPDTIPPAGKSSFHPTVYVSHIQIPNIVIYGRKGTKDVAEGTGSFFSDDVTYDANAKKPLPVSAKAFWFSVPWVQYSDSSARIFIRTANASSASKLLTVDTFSYASGQTMFRGSNLRGTGLDMVRTLTEQGVRLTALSARTWAAQLKVSSRKKDTTVNKLPWQDKLAHSVSFPIHIDSIALEGGALDLTLDSVGSRVETRGLAVHAIKFDFDTGAPARQPFFSDRFLLRAVEAEYSAPKLAVGANDLLVSPQDSLVSAGSATYFPTGGHARVAPISISGLRAEGILVSELFAGREIAVSALRGSAWHVAELPASSNTGTKKSKQSKPANSVWDVQRQIAESISMPIRIAKIDLRGGTVRVQGGTSPTILADGAAIDADDFALDSAAAHSLLFSRDVSLSAGTFHFADRRGLNSVDARNACTRTSRRSVSASRAAFTTRSYFEPQSNNTTYAANDLDLTGIDFAGLLASKNITIATASARSWQIERKSDTVKNPEKAEVKATKPAWQMPIRIGSASLPNGTVVFFERDTVPGGFSQTMNSKITQLEVTQFRFLPPHKKRPRLGFDQILCVMPSFTYAPLDGFYYAEIRNMHANFKDSIITMDSFGYVPKYSEDEFAALHQYSRGRTDFRLAPLEIVGIDARRMINGGGVVMDSLVAPTLWVDYYKDDRKPKNPNPGPAVMPNDIVRSLNLPFTVDVLSVHRGHIQIREMDPAQDSTGDFTFDSVSVAAYPITLDSASPLLDTPTHIDMQGVFIAQAPMKVSMVYPLHDSALNVDVRGLVGPFDLLKLNSYLIPSERVQVMNGQFYHGQIDMMIRRDIATTYVEPIYNHFKLRVLPPNPADKRDIEEGVKTFVANTFILRDDDPDEKGGPPITATTTLARKPDQEFFQFLWLAIRQSLGTVVGGFK